MEPYNYHCNLELDYLGCSRNKKLIIIPNNSLLLFRIKPSNKGRYKYNIKTNLPENGKEFIRIKFRHIPSQFDDFGEFTAEVPISLPGAYTYIVELQDWINNEIIKTQEGHILVQPELKLNNKPITIQSLSIQTVLTKCLGPVSSWIDKLRPSSLLGYNMIHFTPVQQRGFSDSCYSLYDHNQLSNDLFPENPSGKRKKCLNIEASKWQKLNLVIKKMESELNLLSMVDVVLNHCSFDNPHLSAHLEATYNQLSALYLKPAIELHKSFMSFSESLGKNQVKDNFGPIDPLISSDEHLKRIWKYYFDEVFPGLKLYEYFIINVDKALANYRKCTSSNFSPNITSSIESKADILLGLIQETSLGDRFSVEVPINDIIKYFNPKFNYTDDDVRKCLEIINFNLYRIYESVFQDIRVNVYNFSHYEFIVDLKCQQKVSADYPIVTRYFNRITAGKDQIYTANNGWIMDSGEDFSEPGKIVSIDTAYLRRKIFIWGDCTKLRYGKKPEDSKWLWSEMEEYIKKSSACFHGLRLDNAHGTPLHVSSHLIDIAKKTNPNILILAELFTQSEELDKHFIENIGINLLVRESLRANDPFDFSRLLYVSGGYPIGSISKEKENIEKCLLQKLPVVFYDCTHDNQPHYISHSGEDTLSTTALISMSNCAIGSTRGYDEIIPFTLSVSKEKREYQLTIDSGIQVARRILNKLHYALSINGYNESHVHHDKVDGGDDIISIQRNHPQLRRNVVLVSRTAFSKFSQSGYIPSLYIPGRIIGIILSCNLSILDDYSYNHSFINGVPSTYNEYDINHFGVIEKKDNVSYFHFNQSNFIRGSVIAFLVDSHPDISDNVKLMNTDECLNALDQTSTLLQKVNQTDILSQLNENEVMKLFSNDKINLLSLSRFLYTCNNEELDHSQGKRGVYRFDNVEVAYAGIAGVCIPLKKVINNNDMGHSICNNLRNGYWLLDYILERTKELGSFEDIYQWMLQKFNFIKRQPNNLAPLYFSKTIMIVYNCAIKACLQRMGDFSSKCQLAKMLSLTSVQLVGSVPSAPLIKDDPNGTISIAAGFDHFSTGYMRNWGRDTFLSFRGLLLTTNRYIDAKNILMSYSKVVRHGSIPNLMDCGVHSRYNSRDSTWWFLLSLQDYVEFSSDVNILNENIIRLYPSDDMNDYDENNAIKNKDHPNITMLLMDIVQEIMQKQANGLNYIEWNAGTKIDDRMKDNGFNVTTIFDIKTGFIFGGNSDNCGTWMDKMGESERAGNRGIPASPRDGAAIEIIGLLKSTVKWLNHLYIKGNFKYNGVLINKNLYTYYEWDQNILKSFDKSFYIQTNPKEDGDYDIDPNLVNIRGFYKDTYKCSNKFGDYQLRPNQLVAMVVSPDLFTNHHVYNAIENIEKYLLPDKNSLGIRTLTFTDFTYHGIYDNDNDSDIYKSSKGFNYHNGPEWLWLYGYYIRAKILYPPLHWAKSTTLQEKRQYYFGLMSNHTEYIEDDHYASLPELTNENGTFCKFSCKCQAWSTGCLLDALYDLLH